MASVPAVLTSEWTKIRTVASTTWTLLIALVVTVGMSVGLCALMKANFKDLSEQDKLTFDPTSISMSGMMLGQLAMIVFGVLVVGNEYSSGMIRTSLAAVPQRTTFLLSKIVVAGVLTLVVGQVAAFCSFFLGQALLGDHSTTIGDDNVLRAVAGGGLYMGLIGIFAMGVASILRSSMLSLGILMPLFFLISPILNSVSQTKKIAQFLPDQAGTRMTQVIDNPDSSIAYGPWGGFAILVGWVVLAVVCALVLLKKRDA
ncbi:ABC transporter permease subunit [Streptomyces sp. NPDC050738]|uniref:ABC transporter permease subunit n=1 Tax=Streptomyces sp. NPDC050738 TaxID=3154744 RepID=UPI00344853A1